MFRNVIISYGDLKQTTDQLLRSCYEAIPRIWLVNDDVVIAVSWIRMNDESHGKNDHRGGSFLSHVLLIHAHSRD